MHYILIVDDEQIICSSLKARIEKITGHTKNKIFEAQNGVDALQIAKEVELDIVITDIKMPGMNGIELIKEMTREELAKEFIVISGYDDYEYVREAFKSGAVDYLLKPISMEELKEKLGNIFELLDERDKEFNDNAKESRTSNEDKNMMTVVDIAKRYIEQHDIKDIDLAVVADAVSMNYTYFSELFKEETGIRFSDYLMERKMQKAKRLLNDPFIRVQDIGYELGYENPKHFSRAFKNYFGMSPTDFRKRN